VDAQEEREESDGLKGDGAETFGESGMGRKAEKAAEKDGECVREASQGWNVFQKCGHEEILPGVNGWRALASSPGEYPAERFFSGRKEHGSAANADEYSPECPFWRRAENSGRKESPRFVGKKDQRRGKTWRKMR
jgi:hypothetical protein